VIEVGGKEESVTAFLDRRILEIADSTAGFDSENFRGHE
jgi:hypothetical protein